MNLSRSQRAVIQRVEAALPVAEREAFRVALNEVAQQAFLRDAVYLALRKTGVSERNAHRIIASAKVAPRQTSTARQPGGQSRAREPGQRG